ncbi:MAG: polyprenyl synthetase family protein [Anaerolineae bacterium]|nr:polyprenyl synthetase family protein [Anaerolineae bacterium]MDK1080057.1 polyprenyl synthetase family protein [Anaerolineae bacterium]
MSLEKFSKEMLPAIESELKSQVARLDKPHTRPFYDMLTYHLGWTGEGANSQAGGKRLRPLIVLLVTAACEGQWENALPAACAIELVHNFSLVHDDIQDNSGTRRGRTTTWKKWGMPMAINVGDGLFVLSNQAIMDLKKDYPAETVIQAATILHGSSLDLTSGQFLDMSFEERDDLTVEDYWPMVAGKTAALLRASCHLGAILGGADENQCDAYRSFGHSVGIAFQVQDDILGIWGDEAITGKSAANDLLNGKKSLPVIHGINQSGDFAERWKKGNIKPDEVEGLAKLLATEGSYEYTHAISRQMTTLALNSLREADPQGEAGAVLMELANKLIYREQ